MGGGLRRWGLVAASVALPWFARDARASFRRPPPWAAKVPPGVCYHHVASGGREMTVFLRSEDASENASECRMRGDGGSGGAPVVVALHGFGGGAPDMFIPLSEGVARGAGLALAVPRGVNGSWNGHYCCGDAARQGVDDLGALRALLAEAQRQTKRVDASLLFGLGFSNGGLLATDDAARPSPQGPLFRAVVSVAGHALRVALDARPTPVFMEHGAADDVVPFGGCCAARSAVCDQILAVAPATGVVGCRSPVDVFREWLRANRCAGEAKARTVVGRRECRSGAGCAAATTLCVSRGLAHFPEFALPGAAAQVDMIRFLQREACRARGGADEWRADGAFRRCDCARAPGRRGPYCAAASRPS